MPGPSTLRAGAGAGAERRPGPRRVLILSADVGEGHAAAARALSEQLSAQDEPVEVTVIDGLRGMGRTLRAIVEDGYKTQLKWMPWSYSAIYWLLEHLAPARWLGRLLLCLLGSRPLLRRITTHDPDVVVSTYPAITVVLGRLRRLGHVRCPAIATITDLTGLFFWAQPGVDMHLVMYGASIAPVERIAGPESARLVRPLISQAFLEPRERHAARAGLGLDPDAPVILVSGGGWGVGDLAGAVRELAEAMPSASLVCLAGRNDGARRRLEQEFAGRAGIRVLGFTDQMHELLAAADVLVHSTGGVTCLEAMARGCPVVSYGLPVGHAKINTQAMADVGLVRLAGDRRELVALVDEARRERSLEPDAPPAPLEAAADIVLASPERVIPLPAWRRELAHAAAASVACLSLATWALSTDDTASFAAGVLHMRPVHTVATPATQVPIVVRASQAGAPLIARRLARSGVHASFAFRTPPSGQTMAALRAAGDGVVPEVDPSGGLAWLRTRGPLVRSARDAGVAKHRRFFFLQTSRELTTGQIVMARGAGGRPVTGVRRYGRLRAGDVVVVSVDSAAAGGAAPALSHVVSALGASGLRGVPLPSPANASSAGERTRAAAATTTSARQATRIAPSAPPGSLSWKTSGASATGTTV